MNFYRVCVAFCAVLGIGSSIAHDEIITFGFTGEVTEVPPEVASAFTVGDSVVGSYTFDSTAPDISSSDDGGQFSNAISSFSATIGGDNEFPIGFENSILVLMASGQQGYAVIMPSNLVTPIPNTDYDLSSFIIVLATGLKPSSLDESFRILYWRDGKLSNGLAQSL